MYDICIVKRFKSEHRIKWLSITIDHFQILHLVPILYIFYVFSCKGRFLFLFFPPTNITLFHRNLKNKIYFIYNTMKHNSTTLKYQTYCTKTQNKNMCVTHWPFLFVHVEFKKEFLYPCWTTESFYLHNVT